MSFFRVFLIKLINTLFYVHSFTIHFYVILEFINVTYLKLLFKIVLLLKTIFFTTFWAFTDTLQVPNHLIKQVLIYISQRVSDVKHIHVPFGNLYVFFVKMSVSILCALFDQNVFCCCFVFCVVCFCGWVEFFINIRY